MLDEGARALEQLALNETVNVPWQDLRRHIRQRLSQVVEQLAKQQTAEHSIQRQASVSEKAPEEEPKEVGNSGEDRLELPAEKRKRTEVEGAGEPNGKPAEAMSAREQQQEQNGDSIVVAEPAVSREGERAGTEETQGSVLAGPGSMDSSSLLQEANGDTDRTRDIRDLEDRISYSLHTFEEAPFTIQRIAELLAWPERHYHNVFKFLRAVERVVYVTSTVDEFPTLEQKASGNDDDSSEVDMLGIGGTTVARTAATPSSLLSATTSAPVRPGLQRRMAGKERHVDTAKLSNVAARVSVGSSGPMTKRPLPSSTAAPQAGEGPSAEDSARARWPAPAAASAIPPLDASETGILHIRSTAADDKEALRTKIQGTVDADVPVCIDGPDGTSGEISVVSVRPQPVVDDDDKAENSVADGKTSP
ncbi:hypothetical protein GGF46_004843 [Coemansia sp. RSA 552]|nr:hypothetical protein GGF46_004843 [Coemansia sp. RSA 552]